ncbi:MAG: hypothetical protein F6K28_19710 [Microcoleus sp. SIO2G3]|nr:hypothetical protein [Microcoleus sp. SIO2G3]
MNQQRHLPESLTTTLDCDRLFSGIWIRWSALTQSEKVVCTLIALIPLWWSLGWKHFLLLSAASIIFYEIQQHGSGGLQRPSLPVITALAFPVYTLICRYFYNEYNNETFSPNAVLSVLNSWAGFAVILWYIQSKKIRVRLEVVAWAFSVVVTLMVMLWVVIYFVWHQGHYDPPRSLYGLLTGKAGEYEPGMGNSNFLMPYFPTDESLPGLVRYVYFFPGPEALALFMAFTVLLALDIRNRLWSLLLFGASIFLLLTSGTRAVWLSLPIVLTVRYLLTAGKVFGASFLYGLIGFVSFVTLSLPAVTNKVLSSLTGTAQAAGNARADSTEVRGEIYRLTIKGISEASDPVLLFGHVVTGEGVLPGYDPAVVGSHSFILGTLLYRAGLVGTGIFLTYWISLLLWFYKTRADRPMCLLMFIVFSFTFATMELEMPVMPITLICAMLRTPTLNLSDRDRYRQVSYFTG